MRHLILCFLAALAMFTLANVERTSAQESSYTSSNHGLTAQQVSAIRNDIMTEIRAEMAPTSSMMGSSGCCDGCGSTCGCVCDCNCVCPGWSVGAEYLLWAVRSADLDYAIVSMDGNPNFQVFGGNTANVSPEYRSGARFRVGYLDTSGWETAFQYTMLRNNSSSTITDPDGPGGPIRINPILKHPSNIPNAGQEQVATGIFEIDYNVYDFEMARWIDYDHSTAFRFFGGLRIADIDQVFAAQYFRNATDTVADTVYHSQDSNAYGIRVGLEGRRTLFHGIGFSLRLAGSVLANDISYRYLETDASNLGTPEIDLRDDNWQATTVLEAAAAVEWMRGPFSLAAGYEMSNWYGLAQVRRQNNDSAQTAQRNDSMFIKDQTDVLLDGFFVRGMFTY